MSSLTQYQDEKIFATLLASEKMDVADGIAASSTKIPPDSTNRTILIGLGGTGVKTINYVKRTISDKLDPSWKDYIAFLAIDSDGKELASADSLTDDEYIRTTRNGIAERLITPGKYPPAWHRFLDPDQAAKITDPNAEGSGQKRLLGKAKIHDQVRETGKAVDVEIVNKLASRKNSLVSLASGKGKYQVYVIGGISGGTGSGSFLEMPALIRKVLGNGDNVSIYAMLFLPDTLTGKTSIAADQGFVESLQANGYASLKELNYFQGMYMRPGYAEKWYYNDPGTPELFMDSTTDFFHLPYLVGTSEGAAENSEAIARSTVAEFFVSILGKMITGAQDQFLVDSFVSNAMQYRGTKHADTMNPDKEPKDSYHEFPKAFGALGFASAQAPQQIVKAYAVATACDRAGLEPVSAQTRAQMAATGETLLPFLGDSELMTAKAGTEKAAELLLPVTNFLRSYLTAEFSFLQEMQLENVTFGDILSNKYTADLKRIVDSYMARKTGTPMRDALDQKLVEAFTQFRNNVKDYVMKDGPMAFWNLYMGTFIPENGYDGVGIKRMLANLVEGRDATGAAKSWPTADKARADVERRFKDISDASLVKRMTHGQNMANDWVQAVNFWANTCVNEKRREHVLGKFHALEQKLAEPAESLAEQVKAFGTILTTMAKGYKAYSSNLEDYNAFREIKSGHTDVNIAALNQSAHRWIKDEAQKIAATISGLKIREALVDSFFANPKAWLEVDENLILVASDTTYLRDEARPVSARKMFDQCMTETVNFNMDVSIQKVFEAIQQNVPYHQFAADIVDRLDAQSRLLFDGSTAGAQVHKYLVYPANLDSAIATALQNEVTKRGFDKAYESMYADSIMMYRMVAPFELYQLKQLKVWERQYLNRKGQVNNLLHGRSPDIRLEVKPDGSSYYVDNSSWFDYPSICPEEDPTKMREGGIPYEGKIRLEIDKLLEKAKELGVLFTDPDAKEHCYYRVHFDKFHDWKFDVFALTPVDAMGHLPTGKALAKAVAKSEFDNLVRPVLLDRAGLAETPRSNDAWAWTYAKRVLYAHRPMLKEIRETVELMEQWSKIVEEVNIEIDRSLLPAKLIRIMQSHLIYRDSNGVWKNEDDDTILANLSPMMMKQMQFRNPREAALFSSGFELFALHRILNSRGEAEYHKLVDALLPKAQNVIMQFKDPDLLQATFEQIDGKLTKECELLESYGADLANPEEKPSTGFVNKMAALKIQAELLPEICKFYCYAKMWDQIT